MGRTTLTGLIAGAALVVAHAAAPQGARPQEPREVPYTPVPRVDGAACTPSFVNVGLSRLDQRVDRVFRYAWTADVFLVGCAEHLSLSKTEQRLIQEVVREVILREDMGIFAKARQGSFRADVAARVNGRLGRQLATDVILLVSRGEYDVG
jgi:hypothetical protein